jgi:thioredoxin-dependent peroxiredoxin
MLRNGQKAPDFNLVCQRGDTHTPATYAGKAIILLFLRGSFCPTTQRSLAVWQDFQKSAEALGCQIIGTSVNSVEENARLGEKYGLTFPLTSDPGAAVAKSYETYIDTYAEVGEYSEPALFIINADGTIGYSAVSTGPKGLPDPGALASVFAYLSVNGGKY